MSKHLPKIPKGKWINTADIWGNDYFMMSIVDMFVNDYPKLGLGGFVKHYVSSMENGYTPMLFLRREFERNSEYLADKMIKNPNWVKGIYDKIIKSGTDFFKLSEKMVRTDFKKLSNNEIIRLFKVIQKVHRISHMYGASINWMADAEKERFSHKVLKIISDKIITRNLPLTTPEVFSVLTTPLRLSYVEKEENEFLEIAQILFLNKKIKTLFKKNKIDQLKKQLIKFPKEYKIIQKHFKKWRWTPFMYEGPAYQTNHYLERWQSLLKAQQSPAVLIRQKKKEKERIKKQQKELLVKLRFNPKEKKIINIAKEAVWIKGFRKDVLYHGMYCYVPMFKEIGRRNGLTLKQIRNLCQWEIPQILQGKKFDPNELNQRHRFSAMYVTKGKFQILLGREAKQFLAKINMEATKVKGVKEMRGTCACPGKVKGTVKIVLTQADNKKVKKGDILVSHTTGPDLMPAMKRAAAFVTEAGGLTCHAAIVARELNTPCVVGTLIAAKVLKDGDKVEIDATKGVVKKI